jgi:hypothetical protein
MSHSTNIFSGFDLESLQSKFKTDFNDLEQAHEDGLSYIEQCHFGDLLIEKSEPFENERYKLWKVLECNGGGIIIEYCGAANNYSWQTVFQS